MSPPAAGEQRACRQRGWLPALPGRCGVPCTSGTKQWCGQGEGPEAEVSPYRINLYCLAGVGTRVNTGVETVMEGQAALSTWRPKLGRRVGAAFLALSLGLSLPWDPSPPCPHPSTWVLQPPCVEVPQGACAQWEAECQHGAVELSPGRWHQAGPAVGRGASSQQAKENHLRVRCRQDAP